ncbi:MAG: type V CRISPR-associated protein Cas12b, partial [Opitutaceae bacterium]|nr:type V CRISPR-associated protein Cas12b [Opitutaceae bacterium]
LIAENADAPNLYETAKNKDQKKSVDTTAEPKKVEGKALKVSASLLPPKNADEFEKPFHLSMAFPVPVTKLHEKTPKISGDKSIRFDQPKNDFFPGLYFRWPVDIDTETIKKEERKRIWCATDFEPLHILSVDLGVRFAGAWCRAEIAKRKPTNGERVISSPLDDSETGKIVFDIKEVGTFRLQGEDVKIWKKHKGDSEYLFGEEPWGSAGRKAKPEEIAAFKKLAIAILPESTRSPLPDEAELKFFPQLGAHLQFRLARRIGQLRFLFNLRWRAIGKSKKVVEGGEPRYEAQTGKALCALQRENRFRALGMLYFLPRNKQGVLFENINDIPENERGEEESCIKELRKALVSSLEKWDTLVPEGLFKKARTKVAKDALKSAQAEFRKNVLNEAGFNWQALADEASRQIDEIMATLKGMDNGRDSIVARVAHFIWPLRGKEWVWCQCSPCANGVQSHIDYSLNSERNENISGMRGLNMRRIELFQEFRRTLQSIAKQERRYYRDSDKGLEPSVIALGGVIHEPAAAWLRRINEFRDQRVDQTAHLILAEALGLKLKNPDKVEIDGKKKSKLKSERDLHGRYERSKDKPIVSAIVLENLSRYRMSLDRSRFENRQLMEWSHRAILLKLQDMAKVFGIQIFTVDARFSSRFSSRTGVPGIRCAEVAKGFEKEHPWKKWGDETVKGKEKNRKPSERAELIKETAELLNKLPENSKTTLILPLDGGPSFFPVISHEAGEGLESNADINAAVNIGLRAVAHPDCLDVFPIFRAKPSKDGNVEIQKPKRGIYTIIGDTERVLKLCEQKKKEGRQEDEINDPQTAPAAEANEDETPKDADSEKITYLFVCKKNCLTIPDGNCFNFPKHSDVFGATTRIYWSRVKQECLARIRTVNADRLQTVDKDDIPFDCP